MNGSTTKVLLIEDNPGDADLVRLRLVEANSDVQVKVADRLSSGLKFLTETQPALVLLDLNLPDSRGAETFRKILAQAAGIPVVILSGQDDEELASKALHQGAQDYLVKGGFDAKDLARSMRYAIERQSMLLSLDMARKQQLEFKNQFLSHVSHELRTPLTCIHQYVTLLLDGLTGPLGPDQADHLKVVLKSANQLHAMIRDLLEATRAESGKMRVELHWLVLGGLLQQAAAMMRPTAEEKKIGLEVGVDSRVPLVCADPDRVLEVLINLLDNAIKFTPADGAVVIKACMTENDAENVYISVSDTGRGISPEAKSLIFERLYQDPDSIDSNRSGLGLGLFISREIVRLHGGKISLSSELGQGSTFTFTLPVHSLGKLLFPVVTYQGCLRPAFVLLRVDLKPLSQPARGNWRETRHEGLETLRRCVSLDKDLVLPPMSTSGPGETLFVVASTSLQQAESMTKRIREQLECAPALNGKATVSITTEAVELKAAAREGPLEQQVQALVGELSAMIMTHLNSKPGSPQHKGTRKGTQFSK